MKLSGSKRRGRHLGKNVVNGTHESISTAEDGLNGNGDQAGFGYDRKGLTGKKPAKMKKPRSAKKRIILVLAIVLGVPAVAGACLYFYVNTALNTRPPVRSEPWSTSFISPDDPSIPVRPGQTAGSSSERVSLDFTRDMDTLKYTFLLLASDDGANTDVIMAISFDSTNRTIDVVNIPRDTLANISPSGNKKANNIYATMRSRIGWGEDEMEASMDATIDAFANILGFKVDYWFFVDMKAVVALVDAIDGVDFYVPVNMNYSDPYAGLHINYSQGWHRLYGKQAVEVLRYRSGYAGQDIGRIGTQQDFLLSAAQQILAKRDTFLNSPSQLRTLVDIFIRDVKTDIDLNNLIFFANEFLRFDADNINFHILPGNYWDSIGGVSYVTIFLDEWLSIVNEYLNPFVEDISPEDVSILTRGPDRYLYVTDGNRQGDQNWGSGSRGSGNFDSDNLGIEGAGSFIGNSSGGGGSEGGENAPDSSGGQTGGDGEDSEDDTQAGTLEGSEDDPDGEQVDDPYGLDNDDPYGEDAHDAHLNDDTESNDSFYTDPYEDPSDPGNPDESLEPPQQDFTGTLPDESLQGDPEE